ncbi:hypothetical protein SuNHUV7_00560 (plasmid) [Pseudoseohaeicola sp. NH-UV-7]|uniref:pyrimidine dimer DNA glycosylase/endonuclease V n=1 Tax=Sulfitobacter sp. TBRI5 TaxID=2989732 RepID=UPI003A787207
MQTFLPYPDFTASAQCLDYKRLGKQRVECRQILNALEGRSRGWVNHPATRMWADHIDALKLYYNIVSEEWISRGYRHNIGFYEVGCDVDLPSWLGDGRFHLSHQSNLVRKSPAHYRQHCPDVPNDLPYVWPV